MKKTEIEVQEDGGSGISRVEYCRGGKQRERTEIFKGIALSLLLNSKLCIFCVNLQEAGLITTRKLIKEPLPEFIQGLKMF